MNRLAHVCLETQDLDKTEAFYQVLGMERRFEFRNKAGRLVGFYLAFDDQSYIEVIYATQPRDEGVLRHFAIETENLETQRTALLTHGVDVSDVFEGGDRTQIVTCHDPNGVFIEVMQYTDASMQLRGGSCEVDYEP